MVFISCKRLCLKTDGEFQLQSGRSVMFVAKESIFIISDDNIPQLKQHSFNYVSAATLHILSLQQYPVVPQQNFRKEWSMHHNLSYHQVLEL